MDIIIADLDVSSLMVQYGVLLTLLPQSLLSQTQDPVSLILQLYYLVYLYNHGQYIRIVPYNFKQIIFSYYNLLTDIEIPSPYAFKCVYTFTSKKIAWICQTNSRVYIVSMLSIYVTRRDVWSLIKANA